MELAPNYSESNGSAGREQWLGRFAARPSVPEFLYIIKNYLYDVLAGIRRAREYGYGGKGSYQDWYFNQRKKTDWVAGRKTLAMGMYASRGQTDNKPPLIHPLGRSRRCVWTIPTKAFAGAHFAVYPPALVEIPIKAGCPEGGIVLDPFFGGGTTGMVALELKRRFIGIELNPEYIRIAQERIRPYLLVRRLAG